jgi:hypothetical protein
VERSGRKLIEGVQFHQSNQLVFREGCRQ